MIEWKSNKRNPSKKPTYTGKKLPQPKDSQSNRKQLRDPKDREKESNSRAVKQLCYTTECQRNLKINFLMSNICGAMFNLLGTKKKQRVPPSQIDSQYYFMGLL